jgi:hypothetical protein
MDRFHAGHGGRELVEFLKQTPRPPGAEKGMDLAGKALTQKSDRPRASYGSLLMSAQDIKGLCEDNRKCIRHAGHPGEHYPS